MLNAAGRLVLAVAATVLAVAPRADGQADGPVRLPPGTFYNVVTKQTPPFVFVNRSAERLEDRFRGWSVDFLAELAEQLQFQYNITALPDDAAPQELIDGVSAPDSDFDMAIAAITVTAGRSDQVSFTTPYYDLGLRVVHLPTRKGTNLWQFLVPFDKYVWLVNFLVFAVFVVLYYVFERKHLVIQQHRSRRSRVVSRVVLSMYFVFGSIIQAFQGAPVTTEGKLLASTALAFFFVMAATYTANLASFLTRIEYVNRIYDIDQTGEINDRDLTSFVDIMAIRKSSAIETWFQREVVSRSRDSKSYLQCDSYDQCNAMVISGEAGGTIYDEPLARYELGSRADYIDLVLTGKTLNLQGYGIALQKGDPNTDLLSREILRRRGNGLIEELDDEYFEERTLSVDDENDLRAIHVHELGGLYVVLVVALVFCVGWYILQKRRGRRAPKTSSASRRPGKFVDQEEINNRISKQEDMLHDLLEYGECPDQGTMHRLFVRNVLQANIAYDRRIASEELDLTSDTSTSGPLSRNVGTGEPLSRPAS